MFFAMRTAINSNDERKLWQVFKKTSKVFIKYMIKSEYKFLYVYDYSFLVDLSCSYAIFSIKSRPLNINIQRKFFFKNRMSNVTYPPFSPWTKFYFVHGNSLDNVSALLFSFPLRWLILNL